MYAREVESLAGGPTELHVLGLLRLFETLGEAASKVSNAFKQSHPNIPWRQAISMRGRLIHGYDGLAYSVLWLTIEDDIPPLYEELLKARMELHSK